MGLADRVSASLMGSDSFLSREGSAFTYSRGASIATITFYKSDQPPFLMDDGQGMTTEILMTDFRGSVASLAAFVTPQQFDRITDGTTVYEVQPKIGNKVYHIVGGMVHIYTKRVA